MSEKGKFTWSASGWNLTVLFTESWILYMVGKFSSKSSFIVLCCLWIYYVFDLHIWRQDLCLIQFPFPSEGKHEPDLRLQEHLFKKLASTKVFKRIFFKLIQYTVKSWEINKHHQKTRDFETNISFVPRKVKKTSFQPMRFACQNLILFSS